MLRLTMLIYSIAGTTMAGIGVVVAVTLNRYDVASIIIAAAVGAVLALPASWIVARKLESV